MYVAGCIPTALIAHRGIMSPGGIHIRVAQRIRHQINVLGFMIEPRGIGTAQLMGTHAFFQRYSHGAILLHHHLDSTLGYAPALQR